MPGQYEFVRKGYNGNGYIERFEVSCREQEYYGEFEQQVLEELARHGVLERMEVYNNE